MHVIVMFSRPRGKSSSITATGGIGVYDSYRGQVQLTVPPDLFRNFDIDCSPMEWTLKVELDGANSLKRLLDYNFTSLLATTYKLSSAGCYPGVAFIGIAC